MIPIIPPNLFDTIAILKKCNEVPIEKLSAIEKIQCERVSMLNDVFKQLRLEISKTGKNT